MDAMFDQIAECLRADEKVTIAGFGRFEMRPRKPKAYTNPKTKVSSRLESTLDPRLQGQRPLQAEAGGRPCSRRGRQGNGRDGVTPDTQGRTRQASGLFLFPVTF